MRIGIVGCGLVGTKRSRQLGPFKLTAVHDIVDSNALKIFKEHDEEIIIYLDWEDLVSSKDVDAVIVATTHNYLTEVALEAIRNKKHVLIEKPVGYGTKDIDRLIAASEQYKVLVRIGFNHRYHPAILRAKRMIDVDNVLGELMYLRARYGHGGRLGYDREWRADPKLAAGGELVEQGIHIIDLAHVFFGDFNQCIGHAKTFYWDQELDDNAFLLLTTKDGKIAQLHCSCTEWKNTFSFEIYGTNGKLEINGLGGSYGTERLIHYKIRPEMGPPDTTIWEYPQEDRSWEEELKEFYCDIKSNRQPSANLYNAKKAWEVIDKIYQGTKI